jgi:hypothetical protein
VDTLNEIADLLRSAGDVRVSFKILAFGFGEHLVGHAMVSPSGAVVLLPRGDEPARNMRRDETPAQIAAIILLRAAQAQKAA